MPFPTTCPARDVPAVRGMRVVFSALARAIKASMSALDSGNATAIGISRYAEASVA